MSATLIDDPKLTTEEAASYLGLKAQTLNNWRATGREPIPFLKLGRAVRYAKSALDKYLASRTQGATPTESPSDQD